MAARAHPDPVEAADVARDTAAEPVPTARQQASVGRSLAWLTTASVVQQVSGFAAAVVTRGFLGPAQTGVWNLIEVWRQQVAALTLGVHWAADRDMPMLRAQGRWRDEEEVRSATFTYLIAEASVLALGFWAYWLIGRDSLSSEESLGFALVPISATLTTVCMAYQLFLKNRKEFQVFAAISIASIAVDWALVIVAATAGLKPLLIALPIGWVARSAGYWWLIRRLKLFSLRLTLRRRVLLPLLGFGLPLAVWNVGASLLQQLPSLVIGTGLGSTALGFYYLGPQVANALASLPTSMSVISYPNLMERYGASPDRQVLVEHLKDYLRATVLFLAPLTAALGFAGVNVLVVIFLPGFEPGLDAMKIAVLTLLFLQCGFLATQVLIAEKRVRMLIGITAAALAVQGTVIGAAWLGDPTIEDIAWSSVAGQGSFALLALLFSCRLLGVSRAEVREFWGRIPVALFAFGGVLVAGDHLIPSTEDPLPLLVGETIKFVAFTGLALAVIRALDPSALSAVRKLMRTSG